METKLEKPNRMLSLLAYLLVLIGPLLILIFRRKDKFSLYHACQALGLILVAVVVPLGWLVLGWVVTFLSVTAPHPLHRAHCGCTVHSGRAAAERAAAYTSRWSWLDVGIAFVWVLVLIVAVWLLLRLFNVTLMELPETLLWPIGFLTLIGAGITLFFSWRAQRWNWVSISLSVFVGLALLYAVWLVLRWLAPLVLPLAGQLLLMSGFSIVMAAYMTLSVAWIVGIANALRARRSRCRSSGGGGRGCSRALCRRRRVRKSIHRRDAEDAEGAERN